MARLSKVDSKRHEAACKLLTQDVLSFEDKLFVLENWNEGAKHLNSLAGAFFTPMGLAETLTIEINGSATVVDLCAGIGALSFAYYHSQVWSKPKITCIELNPDYVAVGKKILPEATWICANVLEAANLGLPLFDTAIGNPPFGAIKREGSARDYSGAAFEYHVINIASYMAKRGVFIVPQGSAPFKYSGEPCFQATYPDAYVKFREATSIELTPSCGIDCSYFRDQWRGTSPKVEVVCADFGNSDTPNTHLLEMAA